MSTFSASVRAFGESEEVWAVCDIPTEAEASRLAHEQLERIARHHVRPRDCLYFDVWATD